MAFIKECFRCGKETTHTHGSCVECTIKEQRLAKEKFLAERLYLPIEERLTLIESNLFDLMHKYTGPVVFG